MGQISAEVVLRTRPTNKMPKEALKTKKITQKGHRAWAEDYLKVINFPYIDAPLDVCIRKWIWDKKFTVDLSNTDKSNENFGQTKKDTHFNIFTDGSVIKTGQETILGKTTAVGSGAYIFGGIDTISTKLSPDTTIGQAETYAIKASAQWLLKNQKEIEGETVAIYCDSLSTLQALQSPVTTSPLVYKTWQLLNAVANKCNALYLRWCKSHVGIPGNEAADKLAVAAAKSEGPCALDSPAIAYAIAKYKIRVATDWYWSYLFKHLPECRQTKMWWPKVDKGRARKIVKLTRRKWGLITQFMTGHNFLNRHNFLVKPEEVDPTCQKCAHGYIQDTEHIIAKCPYYLGLRTTLFNRLQLDPPFDDLPIQKVLDFLSQSGLEALSLGETT